MKLQKTAIFFFLFCQISLMAQYTFSSHNTHNSILQSINVYDDVIKARTKEYEKKSEEKPLMFLREKKSIAELNRISNSVSNYLKKIKAEADTERILYELVEEDFLNKLLFTTSGNLTSKGIILKRKLDSLHDTNTKINLRGFTHLTQFSEEHFKTDADYFDENGDKVDYFNHFFYDKSNYGMMMALNLLLLDVKTNQLLFFRTVMSY